MGPKKVKKIEESKKKKEVDDDEVDDEKESQDENEEEATHLVGPKRKTVKKKEEDKQVMNEESKKKCTKKRKLTKKRKRRLKKKRSRKWIEEDSDEDQSPKEIKMKEQTEKKISNEKALDEDDDDSEDESDVSLIDDGGKCQLSLEEKEKLKNLNITLHHKVLKQHQVEKIAGTRALKKEEKKKFEKYAQLRTGEYQRRENKILKRNWKDFCTANEWNVKNPRPFLQMRYKNKVAFMNFKERKKFIQFLANGLDNRCLYSVFNRFKIIYDPHKVYRYNAEEDDIIIDYVQHYKVSDGQRDRKFAELALTLKRTRASVWRRFRILKEKRKI